MVRYVLEDSCGYEVWERVCISGALQVWLDLACSPVLILEEHVRLCSVALLLVLDTQQWKFLFVPYLFLSNAMDVEPCRSSVGLTTSVALYATSICAFGALGVRMQIESAPMDWLKITHRPRLSVSSMFFTFKIAINSFDVVAISLVGLIGRTVGFVIASLLIASFCRYGKNLVVAKVGVAPLFQEPRSVTGLILPICFISWASVLFRFGAALQPAITYRNLVTPSEWSWRERLGDATPPSFVVGDRRSLRSVQPQQTTLCFQSRIGGGT